MLIEDWSQNRSAAPTHRYFPEWADLPYRDGSPPESDRNSYSAGGYAEEFGYSLQSGLTALAPTLEDETESSPARLLLIGCLHPGYPERARPLGQDEGLASAGVTVASTRHSESAAHRDEFKVIRVDQRRQGSLVALPRAWKAFFIRLRGP